MRRDDSFAKVTSIWGDKLPVNTDGGLLFHSHVLGATGIAQGVESYRQVRGEAGKRAAPGAKDGLTHAMGGGPNSSVMILKDKEEK